MSDDELIEDEAEADEEEDFEDDLDGEDEELEEDLVEAVGEDLDPVGGEDDASPAADEIADEPAKPAGLRPVRDRSEDEEEDDEDDEADPDDVEEDLDTILRDRIKAGEDDEEDDDEDLVVDDRTEGGDRVAPRAAEEVSCPECFLLVRRSQFGSRRADCPGGLDREDCPMKAYFA